MGAPVSGLQAAEEKTAEALLSAFKHMEAPERRKHATAFNYWLSIRRGRELPPIRDLDPLEISDLAPSSLLIELINAGEDADIRHFGANLRNGAAFSRMSEAPSPSALSCVASKLGIIAISRDALAFEDTFEGTGGLTRCSVTLLPFSMTGEAVDFVYGLVSVETGVTAAEEAAEPEAEEPAAEPEVETEAVAEIEPEAVAEDLVAVEPPVTIEDQAEEAADPVVEEPEAVGRPETGAEMKPGFSKIFDAISGAKGFFGTVVGPEAEAPSEPLPEQLEPVFEPELRPEEPEAIAEEPVPRVPLEPVADQPDAPVLEEPVPDERIVENAVAAEPDAPVAEETASGIEDQPEPISIATEGSLQTKLDEVRSKADEAKAAKLRAEAALVDGLSAAYDFALDAESAPEEYLKLVEGQGLKIQLRSPMKPVVKLAFDGTCDEGTIGDLEVVLAWALKQDLPRGTLAERIEAEGGLSAVLNGNRRAA